MSKNAIHSSVYGWSAPLKRLGISPAIILFIFAILIALMRLHTYSEPMDRDLGDYATLAHEMHYGKQLYSDLPDQKPPAIHITYYLAEAITGYGRGEIYLMTVAASVMTLVAGYAACVGLTGSRSAGLWAAAFWVVISGDLYMEANQPNSEAFMNAFGMLGIAWLAGAYQRDDNARFDWKMVLLAGACFGWATLYKQVVVFIPMFVGLSYIIAPPRGKAWQVAFLEITAVGCVIAAAWGLVVAYFASVGHLDSFKEWVVDFNRTYAGNMPFNVFRSLNRVFHPCMQGTFYVRVLVVAGIALGFARRKFQPVLALLFLAIATHIAVSLPGRFFPHYYQLWFPFLVIGTGCTIAMFEEKAKSKLIPSIVWTGFFALTCIEELPNYRLDASMWSGLKYGSIFFEANDIATRVNSMLLPDEKFIQIGDEAELYPMTGRRPGTRILGTCGLDFPTFGKVFRQYAYDDLVATSPDLIVIEPPAVVGLWKVDERFPNYIRDHYRAAVVGYRRFAIMARKGSALDRRLGPGVVRLKPPEIPLPKE